MKRMGKSSGHHLMGGKKASPKATIHTSMKTAKKAAKVMKKNPPVKAKKGLVS